MPSCSTQHNTFVHSFADKFRDYLRGGNETDYEKNLGAGDFGEENIGEDLVLWLRFGFGFHIWIWV